MITLSDAYSDEEFAQLVAREGASIELKRGAGRKPLQEAMVAFSNCNGGVVFIGVTDKREVVGCALDQGVDDCIHDAAHDAHDVGSFDVRELRVGRRRVVAVSVHPRHDGFAQTSDGRILVRNGARNRALVGPDVWRFLTLRRIGSFETTESTVEVEDCDRSILDEMIDAYRWRGDPAEVQVLLRQRHMLGPGSRLTIAGSLLLTDPSVTMNASKFCIDVRGYDDEESTSYVRRDIIGGPLSHQVRQATALVARDLGTDFYVLNVKRRQVPRLPIDAVREAIANAVAHRSYEEAGAAIVIELRPDRLVVRSPGEFPQGVNPDNLRQAQNARNPTVIDALRRLELAEDSGRGIDLIEDQMFEAFLEPPTFAQVGGSVVATLPLRSVVTSEERAWVDEMEEEGRLGRPERLLLVHAARGARLTNASARSLTGQDSTAARRSLRCLTDEGLLVQHGQRGGSSYTIGELPRHGSRPVSQGKLAELVYEAAARAPITNSIVRLLTGLDRAAARALLRDMVVQGRLVQHGQRRGTTYTAARRRGGAR